MPQTQRRKNVDMVAEEEISDHNATICFIIRIMILAHHSIEVTHFINLTYSYTIDGQHGTS